MAQWADYQMKRNVFASSNKAMWDDARSTSPHDWWFTWASRAPELQYVCMRMHSVAMSTGAMERAWSSYDFVHSIRHNRLSPSRADKLVFIYNNMRNMRKLAKLAALNKRDPGVPWTWLIGDDDDDVDVDPEPRLSPTLRSLMPPGMSKVCDNAMAWLWMPMMLRAVLICTRCCCKVDS